MKPELIPMAEEKSNFGKIVKTAIRLVVLSCRWKKKTFWNVLGTEKSSHDIYIFLLTQHSVFREMWALEYEVDELQHKFADSIGKMDLDNLDVDFIEDMMLKAKPLQTVLNDIRNRQIVSFVVEKLIYYTYRVFCMYMRQK